MENIDMKIIGHIKTPYKSKFGIPRQSGIALENTGIIQFEKEFQVKEMFNGIEDFSHLWIIWLFSENIDKGYSPTVRPPALGGNARKGLFATRSPYRPNPIGMSSVELIEVKYTKDKGPLLIVKGPDMLDGTPIIDIKPYVNMDIHPNAKCSFSHSGNGEKLKVNIPEELTEGIPEKIIKELKQVLSLDPRPAYQENPNKIYGLDYNDYSINFMVEDELLEVIKIESNI